MHSQLVRVLGSEQLRPIRKHLIAMIVYAVLQGVAFALLVPVLSALLDGDAGRAGAWLGLLAAVTAAAGAAYYVQALLGFTTAVSTTGLLYHRLGERLGRLRRRLVLPGQARAADPARHGRRGRGHPALRAPPGTPDHLRRQPADRARRHGLPRLATGRGDGRDRAAAPPGLPLVGVGDQPYRRGRRRGHGAGQRPDLRVRPGPARHPRLRPRDTRNDLLDQELERQHDIGLARLRRAFLARGPSARRSSSW